MTPQELDALEKLAESLATLDSEERDWPLVKIHGRMFHVETAAKAASDGLTALIAELKEARGLITDIAASKITEDNPYIWKWVSEVMIKARAFLARNGKGEG